MAVTIDTAALFRITEFVLIALLPGLIGELAGRLISAYMKTEAKRKEMLRDYDDYAAKYMALAKAGKLKTATKSGEEEEKSIFQQAQDATLPAEVQANPTLRVLAEKFLKSKTAYQSADMGPKILSMILMFGGYRLVNPYFKGRLLLKLPFEPLTAFGIRNMCHSGLDNPGVSDAGSGFVYSLVSYGIRPLFIKLLGLEHERFLPPTLDMQEAVKAKPAQEKKDE